MKAFFLIFIQLFFTLPVFAQHKGHGLPAEKVQTEVREIYTCPMHPEIRSDKPGKCPKCGMTLVKKKAKTPVKRSVQKKQSSSAPEKKTTAVAVQPGQEVDTPSMHIGHQMEHSGDDTTPPFAGKVNMSAGQTVRYDLYVTDTMVNYTGRHRHAFAINGTLPGPDLVFTEGDTAAIYVHNLAMHETSIHWHGVILPNQFDGVPYLTTRPIHTGETHLYKFQVAQNGTYWYHSHSGLQEQAGVYGALVFKKRQEQDHDVSSLHPAGPEGNSKPESSGSNNHSMEGMDMGNHQMQMATEMQAKGNGAYDKEQTVVLSEWTDEHPHQVQRRLRTVNDWYAIKKGSTQSYSEAIGAGHFGTKITNEWKRMNAMDVSDVYYDRFLINGRPESEAMQFKKGDRVRLRIVNAGGSSYFWVQYAGGKMTVIANDGNDVVPIEVDRLIVGVSETYDVVVAIPDDMSYEFRATPEDRTKAASLWLGSGMKMAAPKLPRLRYFEGMKMMNGMMKMNGNMKEMGMNMSLQKMDMNMVMYDEINHPSSSGSQENSEMAGSDDAMNMTDMQGMNTVNENGIVTLNYSMLQSPHKTMLPDAPYKTLEFELTGNMNRYVWSINNKVIREWDKILIEKGQNVRIILFNNSMMRHPMHLHGHDFRVLNGQGEYAPLKNVLDIMPMERDTIDFAGSQDGDWFFHCHILYHMMAGMGNVFSYKNSLPNPEFNDKTKAYNKFLRSERMLLPYAEIGLESNGSDGKLMLPGNRYELRSEWRIGIKPEYGQESETYLGRYLGKMQWWYPFVGFDYHHNSRDNTKEDNLFGQLSNQNNRKAFFAGVEYTLPMLVRAQARIDTRGKLRFQLSREDIPLTPRLRLSGMWNTDKEFMAGFKYIVRKWLDLSAHYDSDMGPGAGITIVY